MAREPLAFTSKRGAVAELLRREIFSAKLKPGSPLRQEQIAARLGVSPTPVREAFRILEAEGYVESRPHRGVVVAERNYADLIDAYEIRLALEGVVVKRIIDQPTQDVFASLGTAVERAGRAKQRGDTVRFRQANAFFHEALALAPGSLVLKNVISRLTASWFFFPHDRERMDAQHQDHLDVIAALRRRDGDEAVRILTQHVQDNIESLRKAQRGESPSAGDGTGSPDRAGNAG